MNTLSFPLSPADVELIHRVLKVNALDTFNATTQNTGGHVMNDLYVLTDNRALVIHEYGVCVYPSMDDRDSGDFEPDDMPHFYWDEPETDTPHLHVNECETLEQLTALWSDNCELIFDELGSADDMLAKHGKRIAINEREWVELFIELWEGIE